jgi:multiple sugar transport system ATP-binding protein
MAVMHGGVLQQYDSPANVFAHPVNAFVASFVGSPAMSLIPADVASADGRTVLRGAGGWHLPLSDRNARKARSSSNGKAVLGARHSTLKLHKSAWPGAVPGRVHTVEPTGDITFAQILIDDEVVNISLDPTFALEPDENVWVEFDQDRLHLFDGATGLALSA